MRFEASRDIAWAALAAWLGGRDDHDDGDWRVLRSLALVMDVGVGDFRHMGAATSDELVSMGLRVVFWVDISAVQEELIGPVDGKVV
jgi:hypothetical protein